MNEPVAGTSGTPAAAIPPASASPDRQSVPASAIFSESDLQMPGEAPVVKPAEAAAAPAAKPAEAAAAPTKPADAAKPAEATPAAKPAEATPAAKPKIKIGGKDYTEAELEAKLAERTAAPAPAPAAAAPEPKKPTPEEITQWEVGWRKKFREDEKISVPFSTDEMETLLSGGEEGAKVLKEKIEDAVASAVLLARKSIYAEMNPTLGQIQAALNPLLQNNGQVEAATAELQFFGAYPEFKDHRDQVLEVTQALFEKYPNEMNAMTRDQQLLEVATQTDRLIQTEYARWNHGATTSWKEAKKSAPRSVAADPVVPGTPAAPAPAVAPVKAPGANGPAGTSTGGAAPSSWHKDTAKSLQD